MQGDGVRVVFNDPQDADYVGMLTNISGLDSPDVREAADDLIGDDGGVHGNFYYGRRPIVLEGQIDNRPNPAVHASTVLVPGFRDWAPTDVANCEMWLAADNLSGLNDGDPVSTWADASGNNRDGVVAGANRPVYKTNILNGKPVVRFDGVDDYMPFSNWVARTSRTVFIVVKRATAGSGNRYLLQFGSTSALLYSPGNSSWVWSTNQAGSDASIGTVTNTNWNLIVLRLQSASSMQAFLNNGASGATTFDPQDGVTTNSSLQIGNTGTNAPDVDVAELISFSGALSDPDMVTVRDYLGAKYGLGWGSTPAQQSISVPSQVVFEENRVRNIRMTALQRVTNAMRKDMQMRWTPQGGVEQVVYLRRQQPLRISGGYNKTFQAALVAADPRIYSAAIQEARISPGTPLTVRNNGSIRTQPVVTIFGPSTGTMNTIVLQNQATGESFVFATAYAIGSGQYIVVDFANKTVTRESGTNIYDQVQYASSSWWQIEPGDNPISFTASGTTTNANAVLRWQDAWV
jgi:hypothetical protein